MPLYIGGRAAATVKEAVCKGTVSFLSPRSPQAGISYFWLKGGKRAEKLAAQTVSGRDDP